MPDGVMKRKGAKFKAMAVMRHIKGETLESLAREFKVPPGDIQRWLDRFMKGAHEYLTERPASEETKTLDEARQTIGRLTMEVDVLKKKMKRD